MSLSHLHSQLWQPKLMRVEDRHTSSNKLHWAGFFFLRPCTWNLPPSLPHPTVFLQQVFLARCPEGNGNGCLLVFLLGQASGQLLFTGLAVQFGFPQVFPSEGAWQQTMELSQIGKASEEMVFLQEDSVFKKLVVSFYLKKGRSRHWLVLIWQPLLPWILSEGKACELFIVSLG